MTIQNIIINNTINYIIVKGYTILKTCKTLEEAKLFIAINRG